MYLLVAKMVVFVIYKMSVTGLLPPGISYYGCLWIFEALWISA